MPKCPLPFFWSDSSDFLHTHTHTPNWWLVIYLPFRTCVDPWSSTCRPAIRPAMTRNASPNPTCCTHDVINHNSITMCLKSTTILNIFHAHDCNCLIYALSFKLGFIRVKLHYIPYIQSFCGLLIQSFAGSAEISHVCLMRPACHRRRFFP